MAGTRNATKKQLDEHVENDPAPPLAPGNDPSSSADSTVAGGPTAAAGTPTAVTKAKAGKKIRFPCRKCDGKCQPASHATRATYGFTTNASTE